MKVICLIKKVLLASALLVCSQTLWAKPELVVQEGNANNALGYTKDGKYLCSVDKESLNVYDALTGKLLKRECMNLLDVSDDVFEVLCFDCDFQKKEIYLFVKNILSDKIICKYTSRYVEDEDMLLNAILFSSHNSIIVAHNKKVTIYNYKTKTETDILLNQVFGNAAISVSTDGSLLSVMTMKSPASNVSKHIIFDLKNKKTVRVHEYTEVWGSIEGAGFRPNSHDYWFRTKDTIILRDGSSKSQSAVFKEEFGDIKSLSFSSDGKVLAVIQAEKIHLFDAESLKNTSSYTMKVGEDLSKMNSIALSPNSKDFAIGFENEKIEVFSFVGKDAAFVKKIKGASDIQYVQYFPWDDSIFVTNKFMQKPVLFKENFSTVQISKNKDDYVLGYCMTQKGLYYIDGSDFTKLLLYNFDTDSKKLVTTFSSFAMGHITASDDGRYVLFNNAKDKKTFLYDVEKSKLSELKIPVETITVNSFSKFSKTGRYVCVRSAPPNNSLYVYDVEKQSVVCVLTQAFWPNFSYDERFFVITTGGGENDSLVYDTKTWKVVKRIKDVCAGFFSSTGKLALVHYENTPSTLDVGLSFYRTGDWVCLNTLNVPCGKLYLSPLNIWFSNDGKRIYSLINRIIRCVSAETGELLFSAIANDDGDWLTYTQEGYFNGSEGGIKSFVHVVDGLKVYPLDQLAEVFFRPDLVAAKIAGKDVSKAAVADLPKPKEKTADQDSALQTVLATGEPPLVQFANPPSSSAAREVQLKFNVLDQGGGIGGVFISVNGKIVQLSGSTKKIEAVSKEKGVPFSPLVSLCAGENVIEAYATNSAGKIESRHAVAKIEWKGEEEKPNLHILALGVNDYAATGVSKLKYAVPDAQSVVQTFTQKSGGALYGRVWTKALLDKDVTKPNIQACVDGMAKNVKADDVFVLYISGHGVSYQGDYYFISYDFDGKNISTAVSKDFLLNNCLSKIKASKTLLLLDTCNSGAIVSGGDSDTAFARLSRATGQAIIAASSDTQTAIEGYDGHGVFTYALLDALSGKADFVGDNKISLLELNLYVSNIVPMLSKLKWNHAQNPWYDLRKQDFVLLEK